jgi:LAO/AO transport system kinase
VDPVGSAGSVHLSPQEAALLSGILAGERRALAKAITLVESTRPEHRQRAAALLQVVLPYTGRSLRIGISGVPGVGKSTFIDQFGMQAIQQGHRVAVLAIDPSSSLSGGSILGDKTRMQSLALHPQAFVRPSPNAGALGGVAARTREVLLLCEAAGFDRILIETVGVGQAEITVAGMTDWFLLLQLPHAGDELQAMKKGVIELADMLLVNKADLDPLGAETAVRQLRSALSLLRATPTAAPVPVLTHSALQSNGVAGLWAQITTQLEARQQQGLLESRRRQQALQWVWQSIDEGLRARFQMHAEVHRHLPAILAEVVAGTLPPTLASAQLLATFDAPDIPPVSPAVPEAESRA